MDAQTLAHHLFGVGGAVLGIYVGGFFGSISQLTWITELSTPFVNIRWLLAFHHLESTIAYMINGFLMTVAFLVFRMIYYYYMIFIKVVEMTMYRFRSFWATYPEDKYLACYACLALYGMMYVLNLYWFSRMVVGLFKGLGIMEAIKRSE